VRVVAATNRQLKAAVAARQFREDLYFRLSVFPNHDSAAARTSGRHPDAGAGTYHRSVLPRPQQRPLGCWSPAAEDELRLYAWPGNVRELQNCIERAAILTEGEETIHPRHLNLSFRGPSLAAPEEDGGPWAKIDLSGTLAEASRRTLIEVERRKIEQSLKEAAGSKGRAAELLQGQLQDVHRQAQGYGF